MCRTFLRAVLIGAVAAGCSSTSSSTDAGTVPDSGVGSDAGLGMDAGVDAGVDAGIDAGADAGTDAGVDAGPTCAPAYPTGTLGGLDCDPMVPEQCGFPFPSNVYLVGNSKTQTCFDVQFGKTTLPIIRGAHLDPTQWSDSDGFSPGQAPMTYMAGATATGMPDQDHIADSLNAVTTPTILLDTSTNPPSLVPHFSEIDATDSDPTDEAILIHPAVRLKDNTRYVVAIRNIVDSKGNAIPPSPTFAALLNGTAAPMISVNGTMMTDPSVAARTAVYADIFAKLQAAGISKTGLQIAWDYTTASKQNNVGQLESMYTQALAALPASGPQFTITGSDDNPDQYTARRIRGLISVPLFLDHAKVTIDQNPFNPDLTTGYTMTRVNGVPQMNGTGQFEFIVNIPKVATTSSSPLPILIQGHGLFGDRGEEMNAMDDHYNALVKLAQNQGYVTITLDMLGWRQPDSSDGTYGSDWPADWGKYGDSNLEDDKEKALGFVSADVGGFRRMIDRGTQGQLNQLIAVKMMETSFAQDSHVMIGPNNASVIDPAHAYYRGDSQGSITGITFMALTHDCLRGYLGEGGVPYNLELFRSQDFAQFLGLLLQNYSTGHSAMNVQLVVGLMQMYWDRWEGDGFAPYITDNLISSDTPSHHVFIVDSLGDHQVTPLATHIFARTIGAVQLQPGIRELYGISGMMGPISGQNVLQEFDFGILTDSNDTVPSTDLPPTGPDDPHDWARQTWAAQVEEDMFMKTGSVSDQCEAMPDGGMPETPMTCTYPTMAP